MNDTTLKSSKIDCSKNQKQIIVSYDVKISVNRAIFSWQSLQSTLSNDKKDIKLWYYKAYVKPKVEYASVVCDSANKTANNKIEKVQRKPARFLAVKYWSSECSLPTSPGCPLKILFDRPGDVPI